jgi:hypothetical protein
LHILLDLVVFKIKKAERLLFARALADTPSTQLSGLQTIKPNHCPEEPLQPPEVPATAAAM